MKKIYTSAIVALTTSAFAALLITTAFANNKAIARLNYAGFSKRGNCTATLISPTKALTARHCVINKPLKDIHLVFGYAKGEWAEHRKLKSVHAHKKRDIAVVCLDKRSKLKPIAIATPTEKKKILSATTTGYRKTRPHLPTTKTCPFQAGKTRARFDCKLEPGMSGAPVILGGGLVGVVSGTTSTYSVIELAVDLPKASCGK